MEIDIGTMHELMSTLATKKGAFCSEMDFQLHLAWEMKKRSWLLSLEYDPMCFGSNAAIDILIEQPERIAIELKYKTALFDGHVQGNHVRLKNQAAHDCGRYDFLKDVSRLERVVEKRQAKCGFAIFLTNDRGYWRSGKEGTADAMFRMCDGRRICAGQLQWGAMASPGTTKGRTDVIALSRTYSLGWRDFMQVDTKNGIFRYLMVEVRG